MDNKDNINVNLNNDSDAVLPEESKHSHHHSSEHRHSHHHHHSHHRKSNSKKEKTKRFLKRNKYKLANGFVAILFVTVLVIMGVALDNISKTGGEKTNAGEDVIVETESTIHIEIPFFDNPVSIAGAAVTEYINSDINTSAYDIYKKYAAYGQLDKGIPVTLSYSVKGIPDGYSVKSAELFVSENDKFTDSAVYNLSAEETSVDVYNLKADTQYYYKFTLNISKGIKTSAEGSFFTADTPRMLNVDGVNNIRDFGGWSAFGDKKIKQGLLFRSAEIDGAVEPKHKITPDGVNTLLTVIGIRTEMDLRYQSDNPNNINMLGVGVEHNYYGVPMYSEVFSDKGKASIRRIFADLADESNYPVLLHCTHGMDRTGTVCYLLGAVLGMSEEDLMKDYQLSAMYHGDLWGENQMSEFIGQLKSYEGMTIQKKAENYLLSAGVTPDEINNIREIYLEK